MGKKNILEFIIIFILLETFFITLASRSLNYYQQQVSLINLLFAIISALNFFFTIIAIRHFISNCHDILLTSQKDNTNLINENINLMRAERHEFINHLQAIYGLIANGENEEAKRYLEDISTASRLNSLLLKISNPTLRVILQNKISIAQKKGIDIQINVEGNLENFILKPSAITAVFGNLIDNAIDAVKTIDDNSKKSISLDIGETENHYYFWIANTGPPISEDIQKKMYEPGFSTKHKSRGYGLSIVKKTVESYDGQIVYDSDSAGFSVIIPKRPKKVSCYDT
ncbi:sensor histidine kinase regulating citrate/malate metabolism [Desulfohalotomaculum tongense]|uniref:sensor histidine kinase n=1 Tax=Desulforadius tongensis TaxID=1216062 RepID=UPI00195AD73F|nr:GHKL domain-containing protein [Desulforadius tongensis]MBM7854674.1 sensor histidine kinase regulating citrate/malate metabolism [Desulforadius tongensis]